MSPRMPSRQVLVDVDELHSPRHLGLVDVSMMTGAIVSHRRHVGESHSCIDASCEGNYEVASKGSSTGRFRDRSSVKSISLCYHHLDLVALCRSDQANATLARSAHDDKHSPKSRLASLSNHLSIMMPG